MGLEQIPKKLPQINKELQVMLEGIGCSTESCSCGGFPDCICVDNRISMEEAKQWFRQIKDLDICVYKEVDGYSVSYGRDESLENPMNYTPVSQPLKTYEEALEHGLMLSCGIVLPS